MRRRWLALIAVAACAGCGRLGFDALAQQGDAAGPAVADAPFASDAAIGFATVSTSSLGGSGAEPTVLVWSNQPDGTLDDMQTTDASGSAQLRVVAGGAVSAAYMPDQDQTIATWHIHTILDVQPGDTLLFGGSAPTTCDPTARGNATVTFAPYAGTNFYSVANACADTNVSGSPYTWPLEASDANPDDVSLVAVDDTDNPIALADRPMAPLSDGATVTFSGADWVPATVVVAGVSGVPAELTTGLLEASFFNANGTFIETSQNISPTTTAGVLSGSIANLANAARVVLEAAAADPTGSYGLVYLPSASGIGITALPPLPPQVSAAAFDGTSRVVSWTTGAGAIVGDRLEVVLDLMAKDSSDLDWTLWAPPTATSIVVPQVAPGVSDLVPASAADAMPSVAIVEFPDVADWNAARVEPEWDSPFETTSHPFIATVVDTGGAIVGQ